MLSDACKVMSSVRCLERVFAVLQTQLPELAAAPAQRWRQVEGCVYCMRQMVAANRVQDPAFYGAEVVGSTAGGRPALCPVGRPRPVGLRGPPGGGGRAYAPGSAASADSRHALA